MLRREIRENREAARRASPERAPWIARKGSWAELLHTNTRAINIRVAGPDDMDEPNGCPTYRDQAAASFKVLIKHPCPGGVPKNHDGSHMVCFIIMDPCYGSINNTRYGSRALEMLKLHLAECLQGLFGKSLGSCLASRVPAATNSRGMTSRRLC